ncbi:double-strand break repair helicase AddA [Aestuariispira insulae]|uniref:DNA 3'-5' helicase n=1 Tax=Aestuariispira insulae TaxID=1461337 RepID=A0A3D9HPK4_9PROT|nr:double-strand break repair helicase AddA [Aestuariispira insulae]RED51402.1 DNA helicase/exodeoxyribonuclease V subunit A [Aestuariispira insulae]
MTDNLSQFITDPNIIQRRASNPGHSVWVSASAGSGKTKVLTDRVLSLLLTGTRPERILCITFTKAAAAEMSNRINRLLGVWATEDEDKLVADLTQLLGREPDKATVVLARQLFARVLDTPGGLKIQTVHSFCQSLLGRFPLEAGVPPNFQVLDDRSALEMMARARDLVLRRARTDQALGNALFQVTRRAAEDRFGELMQILTTERGRIRRLINATGSINAAAARLFARIGAAPDLEEGDVIRQACEEGAFDRDGLRASCEALIASSGSRDQARGDLIASWLETDLAGRIASFEDYRLAFLKKTDLEPVKDLMVKKLREDRPDLLDVLEKEQQRQERVLEKIKRQITAGASAGLLRLGAAILEAYEAEKDSRDTLDFDDLILKSRDLLTGGSDAVAWVLFKLDGGLDHILIDEAQDTNPEQWQVVGALAEEFFTGDGAHDDDETGARTVFAVGDVKQSIYSFQRADPAEFHHMRLHFEERVKQAMQVWDMVPMDVSFRSTPAVLRAVDLVFAADFAKDGLVERTETVRHQAWRQGQAGRVEVWPLIEAEKAADPDPWTLPLESEVERIPKQRLANLLAAQIANWIGREPLPAQGRAMRAGDIMILVRQRSAFVDMLVRALKNRQVPVAGADRMILSEQIAVMDLVVLAKFLLMPGDDLSLATVLKSPLVGLTDDDLFTLAYNRQESLWQRLNGARGDDPRFEAACQWLRSLRRRMDRMRPFELIGGLLAAPCPALDRQETRTLTGREAMIARLGVEAEDPLEEFLSMTLNYEQGNTPSLEGFLHWFAAGEAQIKRDLEAAGRDEVRIMTVHGAKGLQAPVVILPDSTSKPEPGRGAQLYWLKEDALKAELPLWVANTMTMEREGRNARLMASLKQDQEYRRLLYVALTRAEDRLIVCGAAGARKPRDDCWYNLVREGLSTEGQAVDFDNRTLDPDGWAGEMLILENAQEQPVTREETVATTPTAVASLPDWVRGKPSAEPVPPRPLAPSAPEEEDPPARSPLGQQSTGRYRRGILVHRLLQTLPDLPPEQREEAARRFLALPGHGLDAPQADEIGREVTRVLTHPQLAPAFGPGSRAEVPIVGMVKKDLFSPQVISGQVDRLLVTDDQVIILDFKTLRPSPMDPDKVPKAYMKQMAAYRDVLRQLYPDRPVRCALIWTEGPKLMFLDDVHLDRA